MRRVLRLVRKFVVLLVVFVIGYGLGLWTWTQPWGPAGAENVERTIREEMREQGIEEQPGERVTRATPSFEPFSVV